MNVVVIVFIAIRARMGHVAIILNPPPRVEDVEVPSRELIFVLDTSGSMRGFPIEKAKEVMNRAIDSML